MLERDVNNMREAFGRASAELLETEYAREIWRLYESGELTPDSVLTGRFERETSAPDVDAVLAADRGRTARSRGSAAPSRAGRLTRTFSGIDPCVIAGRFARVFSVGVTPGAFERQPPGARVR